MANKKVTSEGVNPELAAGTTIEEVVAGAETTEGVEVDTITTEDNGDLSITKDDVEFTVPVEAIEKPEESLDSEVLDSYSPEFNETAYLATYPDVQQAVINGQFKSGLDHYEKYGKAEGR
jgi:hypothetical protein